MKRPAEVSRAIDYLKGIWGDYGRHKRYTETIVAYIEQLENQLFTRKDMIESGAISRQPITRQPINNRECMKIDLEKFRRRRALCH